MSSSQNRLCKRISSLIRGSRGRRPVKRYCRRYEWKKSYVHMHLVCCILKRERHCEDETRGDVMTSRTSMLELIHQVTWATAMVDESGRRLVLSSFVCAFHSVSHPQLPARDHQDASRRRECHFAVAEGMDAWCLFFINLPSYSALSSCTDGKTSLPTLLPPLTIPPQTSLARHQPTFQAWERIPTLKRIPVVPSCLRTLPPKKSRRLMMRDWLCSRKRG